MKFVFRTVNCERVTIIRLLREGERIETEALDAEVEQSAVNTIAI